MNRLLPLLIVLLSLTGCEKEREKSLPPTVAQLLALQGDSAFWVKPDASAQLPLVRSRNQTQYGKGMDDHYRFEQNDSTGLYQLCRKFGDSPQCCDCKPEQYQLGDTVRNVLEVYKDRFYEYPGYQSATTDDDWYYLIVPPRN